MFGRRKIAAILAEFLGTYVLASVVLTMVARTQFPFFAAIGAGLTLAVVALSFGKVSGAQINPAVTIGLWTVRRLETSHAFVYIVAQLLGGLTALRVGEAFLGIQLQNTAAKGVDWKVIAAEAVGTFIFTMAVASAVSRAYEGGKLAATVGIGLALGVMVASLGGNGVLNPAVALGINSWGAAYVLGPVIGSILGFGVYWALFAPLDNTLARRVVVPAPTQPPKIALSPAKRKTTTATTKVGAKKKTATKKKS